ncbi:MAG: sn-glycerol-3-phosphate ABC transporter ATP-binding protein UgpC [Phycisphaerales bacterium]
MALVALKSVNKTYPNGFQAVKDFNLDIKDGEFVVFVGPSGCGKSTTLRMVAGLEDVSGGSISIGDRVVNDVHPKDRDIAMVFQSYALYPHMSVYKNMAFALKLRKVPKDEIDRRVRGVAKTLGLTEMLDRKPRQLSGGQRQRVALGRAIVREPKAFLFDEPLSNLDAKLRVTTRAELKALHQRLKTTTIYVTHDQEEAMTLGDRIVVMSNGLIQQVGPPLEVYRNPRNRFVAAFVGTPPMNFLDGALEKRGDSVVFLDGAGIELPSHPARAAALAAHIGKPIVLGIRPQMFALEPSGHSDAVMRARVNVVEPLGDTVDVSCSTTRSPHLVARLPARGNPVPAGQDVTLHVAMDLVHYFEPGEFGAKLML